MKPNNPSVDTIIWPGPVVLRFPCRTDSSDSPGLGQDLTAAFVAELEEALPVALGHNDTLHGTLIHQEHCATGMQPNGLYTYN